MLDRSRISVWLVCSHERNKDFLRSLAIAAVQGTVIDQGMSGPCVRISGFSIDAGKRRKEQAWQQGSYRASDDQKWSGPSLGIEWI